MTDAWLPSSRERDYLPVMQRNVAAAGPEPAAADSDLLNLGACLPRNVFLGSSSWNFPGWRGLVWSRDSPVGSLAERGLSAYSRYPIFRTAGIDRAFYRPLSAAHYRRFAEQVPEEFRFLVKAPRAVTDILLRDGSGRAAAANSDYLSLGRAVNEFIGPVTEGLGQRTGPLVFEFAAQPMFLLPGLREMHAAIERMAGFLAGLPVEINGVRPVYASEMRTRALFTPRFVNAVRQSQARLAIGVHPCLPSVTQQVAALKMLDAPGESDGDWILKGDVVVRWSLPVGGSYRRMKAEWSPFDRIRRPDEGVRQAIAQLLDRAVKSGVRAFAVANNKAEGCSPLTMRAIAGQLASLQREHHQSQPLPTGEGT